MKALFVIPARGGSKGLKNKNIKLLNGKPLIGYSIELARKFVEDKHICVSSDDENILRIVIEEFNLQIPFKRPDELGTDESGTREVLLHAIRHYEDLGYEFKTIVLLQPTSPCRSEKDVRSALDLYYKSEGVDMVVSVKETKGNPYFTLFEEDNNGYLYQSKNGSYTRRQDCPKVYEYNGAIYVINVQSLKNSAMNQFPKIKKHVMSDRNSIDIDTPLDFEIAEYLIKKEKSNE